MRNGGGRDAAERRHGKRVVGALDTVGVHRERDVGPIVDHEARAVPSRDVPEPRSLASARRSRTA